MGASNCIQAGLRAPLINIAPTTRRPLRATNSLPSFASSVRGYKSLASAFRTTKAEARTSTSASARGCLFLGEMEGEKKAGAVEEEEEEVKKEAVDVSLKQLSKKLDDFAKERDWEQYHNPRNLLLAMIGEVGELSELFMWKGEVPKGLPGWGDAEKEHLGEELSDVLLYLIRLADVCGVDLGDAATRKIVKNAVKYPAPSNSKGAKTSS